MQLTRQEKLLLPQFQSDRAVSISVTMTLNIRHLLLLVLLVPPLLAQAPGPCSCSLCKEISWGSFRGTYSLTGSPGEARLRCPGGQGCLYTRQQVRTDKKFTF